MAVDDVPVVDLSQQGPPDDVPPGGKEPSPEEWQKSQNKPDEVEMARIRESRQPPRRPDSQETRVMKMETIKEISGLLITVLRRISDLEDIDQQMKRGENPAYKWCKNLIRSVIAKVEGIHKDLVPETGY